MRIAYLAAGAAGMYCGSCLHDNTLAAALLARGEDVLLTPIYTPIRTDEVDVSQPRVFFGGLNSYLQQKWSLFRRLPRWIDGWLDSPRILNLLSGRAGSVDPAQLGDLTVSMLRGEEGNQRKELDKLVDWLVDEARPDVVHLSNAMMLGLARRIAQRCGPPVVCSLSGEDIFLEKLTPPWYERMRQTLAERARDVDAFVALNRYYADFMAAYLPAPRHKVHVIPHGLALDGHGRRAVRTADRPARIGFLSRICHDKGLHLLVEGAELLAGDPSAGPFEVHVAGYLGAGDRSYFDQLRRQIERGPLKGRFHYHGEPDRKGKIAFLQSLDLLAIPAVYRESKGLPVLEAWANGVPAIVPRHGTYPELIADVGGGLLHEPHDARSLAAAIRELLANPARREALGAAGRAAVVARYHADAMAERTLDLYRDLLARREARSSATDG